MIIFFLLRPDVALSLPCLLAQLKIKSILNFELGIAIFVNTCGELLLYYRTLIESKLQTKKMPLNFKGICIFVVTNVISKLNEKSNSKFTY